MGYTVRGLRRSAGYARRSAPVVHADGDAPRIGWGAQDGDEHGGGRGIVDEAERAGEHLGQEVDGGNNVDDCGHDQEQLGAGEATHGVQRCAGGVGGASSRWNQFGF